MSGKVSTNSETGDGGVHRTLGTGPPNLLITVRNVGIRDVRKVAQQGNGWSRRGKGEV